ncbi:MAG TPA: DUF3575 domain-containing protein [Porphyromonadaceae bacterium]|jgi:hypothetical protein|nr:DUF3575 domain-containing protein [Porphyromonadaceae bacterium]
MKRTWMFFGCFLLYSAVIISQTAGIKTNIPYWGLITPNLGIEVALGKKATFEVSGGFNPFTLPDNKYLKHWLAYGEFRYWTCEKFNGHFFGLHGLGGQYNVGGWDIPFWHFKNLKKDSRYQGYAYGGGISYGYQWILNNRWNLELTLGGGYAQFHYEKFPCTKCGTSQGKDVHEYLGPTKGAISIIYIIK